MDTKYENNRKSVLTNERKKKLKKKNELRNNQIKVKSNEQ